MKAWLKVIGLGLTKWPMKILALFWVPFLSDYNRINHPIFGVRDASLANLTWYNIAFRNGCHNMYTRPMPEFNTIGNTDDETLEKLDGVQWRYRKSGKWIIKYTKFEADKEYVSFRITWGKPRNYKGKKEFYIGWTMNEEEYMRLTFFQLRPF